MHEAHLRPRLRSLVGVMCGVPGAQVLARKHNGETRPATQKVFGMTSKHNTARFVKDSQRVGAEGGRGHHGARS